MSNIYEEDIVYRTIYPSTKIRIWRISGRLNHNDVDETLKSVIETITREITVSLRHIAYNFITLGGVNAVEVTDIDSDTQTPKESIVLYKDWP